MAGLYLGSPRRIRPTRGPVLHGLTAAFGERVPVGNFLVPLELIREKTQKLAGWTPRFCDTGRCQLFVHVFRARFSGTVACLICRIAKMT